MEYYLVTYHTKRRMVTKNYLTWLKADKFFKKVILRKNVEFACIDFNTSVFSIERVIFYKK